MLKKLFDFKLSKPLLIAKIVMLVCFAVAIVITFFGLKEIVDTKHMKEVLAVTKPTMRLVMIYLLKKYEIWAGLLVVGGSAGYLITRFIQNNKK